MVIARGIPDQIGIGVFPVCGVAAEPIEDVLCPTPVRLWRHLERRAEARIFHQKSHYVRFENAFNAGAI